MSTKQIGTKVTKEDDDDDMSAIWRAIKKERQEKRASNREASSLILQRKGISFEVKNFDAHLIVTHEGQVVDFWPGTGKYIFRGSTVRGHGVFNLLKALNVS
jgi:hypothetical protein